MNNQPIDDPAPHGMAILAQPHSIMSVESTQRRFVSRRDFLSYGTAIAGMGLAGSLVAPGVADANPIRVAGWIWRMLLRLGRALFGSPSRSIVRVAPAARSAGAGAALWEVANGFVTIRDLLSIADLADSLIAVEREVHASIKQHGSEAIWFRGELQRYQLSFLNDSGGFVAGQLMFEVEDLETLATTHLRAHQLITLDPGASGVLPRLVTGVPGRRDMYFPRLTTTGPKVIRPYLERKEYVLFDEIGPIQVVDRSDVQLVPGASV